MVIYVIVEGGERWFILCPIWVDIYGEEQRREMEVEFILYPAR